MACHLMVLHRAMQLCSQGCTVQYNRTANLQKAVQGKLHSSCTLGGGDWQEGSGGACQPACLLTSSIWDVVWWGARESLRIWLLLLLQLFSLLALFSVPPASSFLPLSPVSSDQAGRSSSLM